MYKAGVSSAGTELEVHQDITDSNMCQDRCQENTDCDAWQVDLDIRNCTLFSGGALVASGIRSMIAGYKDCKATTRYNGKS